MYPEHRRELRKEYCHQFRVSLGYMMRLCLKNNDPKDIENKLFDATYVHVLCMHIDIWYYILCSLIFIYFCVHGCFVCMTVCAPCVYQVLEEARRGHQDPWNCRYRHESQLGYCELNPGPLEERPVLLTAVPCTISHS